MKKLLIVTVGVLFIIFLYFRGGDTSVDEQKDRKLNTDIISADRKFIDSKNAVFFDSFRTDFELSESSSIERTQDLNWWLSSGGLFVVDSGIARTIHSELRSDSYWYKIYKKNNPRDTDDGRYPQNIFRLVQTDFWKQYRQQAYFRVLKSNFSASSYRNDSNGLLLFNRYIDQYNLYYTGIRVDGFAVIKKKVKGKYFTLAYNQIYPGKYDRKKNPNLLPHGQWIGLRSEVMNSENGSVNIKLYLDKERNGNWELVAEAVDDGKQYGGKAMTEAGHGGIRTDFMDVEFDDYRIEELK